MISTVPAFQQVSNDGGTSMLLPASDDGFTSRLLQKIGGVRWSRLDQGTQEAALRHLLDSIAVIYGGSREHVTDIAESTIAAVRAPSNIPVLGRARRFDVLDATYVMAVAGHCLEFDDGYRAGSAHPGPVTVPAALAVACFVHASGEALLEAVVAGYEAITNITRVAHPTLRGRGFHSTPAAGVFSAAAAAGHLLGLDERQQRNAFGLAASSAGGLFAFVQGGEDVKPLHTGHAAREGVFAALLAKQGADAPPRAIEGEKGFLAVLADQLDVSGASIDSSWGVTDCYIKPWPGCRHLQPSIDAVLQLQREYGFSADQVKLLEVETYRSAADRAAAPWTSFSSALLSFPFVLSTALIFGNVRLENFTESARSNPQVDLIAQRITVRASHEMDERYRYERPSKVTITLDDGRVLERDMRDALGAPAMPLGAEDLRRKFLDLAGSVTNAANAGFIHAAWTNVSQSEDVSPLVAIPM